MTDFPMSAKIAIVTGAGAGSLGRATAVALADRGVTVVAVDRNEHALRELPDGVRREVADTTAATRLIDRIAGDVGTRSRLLRIRVEDDPREPHTLEPAEQGLPTMSALTTVAGRMALCCLV